MTVVVKSPTKRLILFITFLLMMILTAACQLPSRSEIQPDATDLANITAKTQTAIAVAKTIDNFVEIVTQTATPEGIFIESATPVPSDTSIPTLTPTQAATETNTPSPIIQPEGCIDGVKFVEETVKDNSKFGPNKPFIKTWTLKNTGTCFWTPSYSVVFISGDQMGADNSKPIDATISPEDEIEISMEMVSPAESGVYQGNWKLRNDQGVEFGLGSKNDQSFWVKINVVESVSEMDLGDPDWKDDFKSQSGFWPLGDDENISFNYTDQKLILTAHKAIGDQWRINSNPSAKDYFLEVTFKTGAQCSGKDSYGVIVRSSESDPDVYGNGYVFVLSCDGMYRLYSMNDNSYIGLLNWTGNPDINNGPDQENVVGILIDGKSIKLFVNDIRLAEVNDSMHESGQWGLSIRSMETSNFAASVSSVQYWILDE